VRCGICLIPRVGQEPSTAAVRQAPCVPLSSRRWKQVSFSNQRPCEHLPSRHPARWLSLTNMHGTRAVCQSSDNVFLGSPPSSVTRRNKVVRRVALQPVAYPDGVAPAARLAGLQGLRWILLPVDIRLNAHLNLKLNNSAPPTRFDAFIQRICKIWR
jgi:hypothetical protein